MLLCNCPVDLSPVYSPGLLKKTWYSFCSSTHDVYILYILHKINNEYNCTNLIAHVKECKHNLLLRSTTLLYPTTCAVLKLQQITALTTVKKRECVYIWPHCVKLWCMFSLSNHSSRLSQILQKTHWADFHSQYNVYKSLYAIQKFTTNNSFFFFLRKEQKSQPSTISNMFRG